LVDKISNPHNYTPQKSPKFFSTPIGMWNRKKYIKNTKNMKKNSKRWNLRKILDFEFEPTYYLYSLKKINFFSIR